MRFRKIQTGRTNWGVIFIDGLLLSFLLGPGNCWGLSPEQVVVVANKTSGSSVELAEYYLAKRNIPNGIW
jgi:hypothetical protein